MGEPKFKFIFSDYRTVIKIIPKLLIVGAYTFLLEYFEHDFFDHYKPDPTIFQLLGIVLGLLLVFRTNTAYERWWEGRRLLGSMVNSFRNIGVKLNSLLPKEDKENREFFSKMLSNYSYAMKEHLREGVRFEELEEAYPGMKEELKKYKHIPNQINARIYERITQLSREGKIQKEELLAVDKQLDALADVIGGCERIKNTPIPLSYRNHLSRFVWIYILLLPFGILPKLQELAQKREAKSVAVVTPSPELNTNIKIQLAATQDSSLPDSTIVLNSKLEEVKVSYPKDTLQKASPAKPAITKADDFDSAPLFLGTLTMMIVFFALEGIKAIGEEIEDPFGTDANDLPTDDICTRIKANMKEIFQVS